MITTISLSADKVLSTSAKLLTHEEQYKHNLDKYRFPATLDFEGKAPFDDPKENKALLQKMFKVKSKDVVISAEGVHTNLTTGFRDNAPALIRDQGVNLPEHAVFLVTNPKPYNGDYTLFKNIPTNAQGYFAFAYTGNNPRNLTIGLFTVVGNKVVPVALHYTMESKHAQALKEAKTAADIVNTYLAGGSKTTEPAKPAVKPAPVVKPAPAPKSKAINLDDLPSPVQLRAKYMGPKSPLLTAKGKELDAALAEAAQLPTSLRLKVFEDLCKNAGATPQPIQTIADVALSPEFEAQWESRDADQIQELIKPEYMHKQEDAGKLKEALADLAELDAASGYEQGYVFYLVLYGAYDGAEDYAKFVPRELRTKTILTMAETLGMISADGVAVLTKK